MKICNDCQLKKEINQFNSSCVLCKSCQSIYNKKYRKKNSNKIKIKEAEFRKNNKEKIKKYRDLYCSIKKNKEVATIRAIRWNKDNSNKRKEIANKWSNNNKEKRRNYSKKYLQTDGGKVSNRAKEAKRRAKKLNATMDGFDQEIRQFYKEARELEKIDNIKRHVDHIIPLQGKAICGLHVPWNLQILTETENLQKSNKLGENFGGRL